jgi:hypothetical protein
MSTAAIVVCVEVDLDDLREGDTATEAVRDAVRELAELMRYAVSARGVKVGRVRGLLTNNPKLVGP